MKAFALVALVALIACTSGSVHRSSRNENVLVRHRRAETVTRAEKDSIICVMTNCNEQFTAIMEALKNAFGGGGRIDQAKLTQTCNDYKSVAECIDNLDCTLTPGIKEAFNMLGVISFICDNHKAAFVKHGACIIDALKGDGVKNGCEHLGKPSDFQHLLSTGQRSLLKRLRRQTVDTATLDAIITPGLMKMKEAARKVPAIDCNTLQVLDLCIEDRVSYKCNADGTGDAARLADALYKDGITRVLKGVEGLLPDRDDIQESTTCFAGSSFRFWFW